MGRTASTQPPKRDDYAPIVHDVRKPESFRADMATTLQKMLLDHPDMRLAKVILEGKFKTQVNAGTDVVIVGLHEDDFYLELPMKLRMWVFKPIGTDKISMDHYAASRVQGIPLSVDLDDIRGFQWIKTEGESEYIAAMVGETDE
jgi:hypothetical protein